MNDKTRLRQIDLAIASYNAMIRALKKQAKNGSADSLVTRRTIARYQRGRDVLYLRLGFERIA
jgi:hypothetical protein